MPPKRKRIRDDPDVIKTQRDFRRATGDEKDDDFDVVDEPKINLDRGWTTIGFTRYKRAKLRESMPKALDPFPFLNLPAEIRNMVYRFLVVSRSPNRIRLDVVKDFQPGGIDIAIMLTSRQIYNEAAKILYSENKCVASNDRHPWNAGLALRVDDSKTANTTSRSLRSGRAVDMIKYRGLIYESVLQRLRHLELRVNLFDRSQMCSHITLHFARSILNRLYTLSRVMDQRTGKPKKDIEHGRDWKIVIISPGMLGLRIMRKILSPVIYGAVPRGVRDGKLQVVLEGTFPNGWDTRMFNRFLEGDGFVTGKVDAVDAKDYDVNSMVIEDYFEYGEDMW